MPSVLSGVRKMNWYFLSSLAFLTMLSREILIKIVQLEILSRTSPSVNSIHEDVKLVEDPEGRSHRVP